MPIFRKSTAASKIANTPKMTTTELQINAMRSALQYQEKLDQLVCATITGKDITTNLLEIVKDSKRRSQLHGYRRTGVIKRPKLNACIDQIDQLHTFRTQVTDTVRIISEQNLRVLE